MLQKHVSGLTFADFQAAAVPTPKPEVPEFRISAHKGTPMRPITPKRTGVHSFGTLEAPAKNVVIHDAIDRTWDNDWSNGRTKFKYKQPAPDGLLIPYGTAVPWGERVDRANELAWLISTQDADIATTVDVLRTNQIAAFAIEPTTGDDDDLGIQIADDDDLQHPTAYEAPSTAQLRRIEWEKATTLSIGRIFVHLVDEQGTIKVTPPQGAEFAAKAGARLIRGLGIRKASDIPTALGRRAEYAARRQFYGPDWLHSLTTPEATLMDPLNKRVTAYDQIDPERRSFPRYQRQEDLDLELLAELRDAETHMDLAYGYKTWDVEQGRWTFTLHPHEIDRRNAAIERNPVDSPEALGWDTLKAAEYDD